MDLYSWSYPNGLWHGVTVPPQSKLSLFPRTAGGMPISSSFAGSPVFAGKIGLFASRISMIQPLDDGEKYPGIFLELDTTAIPKDRKSSLGGQLPSLTKLTGGAKAWHWQSEFDFVQLVPTSSGTTFLRTICVFLPPKGSMVFSFKGIFTSGGRNLTLTGSKKTTSAVLNEIATL